MISEKSTRSLKKETKLKEKKYERKSRIFEEIPEKGRKLIHGEI